MMKTYFYRIVTASFVIAIGLSSTTASGQINFKGLKKKVEKEAKSAPKKKKKSSSSSSSSAGSTQQTSKPSSSAGSTQQTSTSPPSGTTSSSSQGSADGKSENAQQSGASEAEPMFLSSPMTEFPSVMQVDKVIAAEKLPKKGALHAKVNPKRFLPMVEKVTEQELGIKLLKVVVKDDTVKEGTWPEKYKAFNATIAIKKERGCQLYDVYVKATEKKNYEWQASGYYNNVYNEGMMYVDCNFYDGGLSDEEMDKLRVKGPEEDPNYHYSSHKATWRGKEPLRDGFFFNPNKNSDGSIDYRIKWPKESNYRVQSITYSERLSKAYGKPAFYGNPFTIQFNGDSYWKNWGYGDDNMKRCLQPEAGVFLFYGDDQLGRSRKVRGGSVPYLPDYTSDTKVEEYPVLVLARTEAKLKEWTQQRAKDEVAAFEDKIRKQVMSESRASLAAVRMPNKGGMHTAANFSRAEGLVKALCERDGTDYKNLVLTSDKWKVVYKPNGVKDYRIFMGYFADHAPSNEYCIIHTVSFRENATSNGEYSGKWYIPGVGQDPNVGPETPCENVEKK